MAFAASAVLASAVAGLALWPTLPARVPRRWRWDEASGFSWVSGTPVEWVDKSVLSVFGSLMSGFLLLAVGTIAIWIGLPRELLVRMRRLLFRQVSAKAHVVELSLHDGLWAWLTSGIAVAMAADSWEMWLLALGVHSGVLRLISDVCVAGLFLGLVVTLRATWLQLKQAATPG